MNNLLHVGLDVGSTTVKIAVMDNNLNTIYTSTNVIIQIQKIQYVQF